MLFLITYDVETTSPKGEKRLRDVAKECQNYGQRVQNSVFECLLDTTQYTKLKILLSNIIDKEKDSIRFYNMGNHFSNKVDTLGIKNGLNLNEELIL